MAWDAYVYIYTYIMCSSLSSIRYPACPREVPGQELAFGWSWLSSRWSGDPILLSDSRINWVNNMVGGREREESHLDGE